MPSVDMVIESWRSSSSSSRFHTLPPYCSPSASMNTAARSGPLRARCLLGRRRLAARQRGDDALDFVVAIVRRLRPWRSRRRSCSHWRTMATVSFGLRVGELADLLHRLGVDLALHLGDVDHLGGRRSAWPGWSRPRRSAARPRGRAAPASASAHRLVRRDDAAHQRAHHQEQHHEAEQQHDAELDRAHDVVLGELQHRQQAGRLVDAR